MQSSSDSYSITQLEREQPQQMMQQHQRTSRDMTYRDNSNNTIHPEDGEISYHDLTTGSIRPAAQSQPHQTQQQLVQQQQPSEEKQKTQALVNEEDSSGT